MNLTRTSSTCLPRFAPALSAARRAYAPPILAVAVSVLFAAATAARADQQTSAGPGLPLTKEALIQGIRENYEKFRRIPNLTLKYQLTYTHVAGARRFAFDKAELSNVRKGEKLRTYLKAVMREAPTVPVERLCTWDGGIGMERLDEPEHVALSTRPDNLIFYYSYYLDFLSYPDGSARVPKELGTLAVSQEEYWIPEALEKGAAAYRLRPALEREGDALCYVLEKPGSDLLWIDAGKGFALRRRDCFHPGGKHLRERTRLEELRQVADVWLPHRVTREDFGGLDEGEKVRDKVCSRKVIDVTEASTAEVPDDQFLLTIKPGVTVHDRVRGLSYTRLQPGEDPMEAALVAAQSRMPSGPRYWLLINAIALVGLALGLVTRHIRRSGQLVERSKGR